MDKKGFSLIELLIVVAIIAVLAGVAVPYYNDYIVDSRTSVLNNNIATIRKAINQFRGDNQRGPLKIKFKDSLGNIIADGVSDPFDELVNGPVQYIAGKWVRRSNVKYLNSRPELIDPQTGNTIATKSIGLVPGSMYCLDTSTRIFDVNTDWCFIDSVGDGQYHPFDINPFNHVPHTADASTTMDYTDIYIISD